MKNNKIAPTQRQIFCLVILAILLITVFGKLLNLPFAQDSFLQRLSEGIFTTFVGLVLFDEIKPNTLFK